MKVLKMFLNIFVILFLIGCNNSLNMKDTQTATSDEDILTQSITKGVTSWGNGYYIIRSRHSLKVLDIDAFSTENGGNIIQWDFHGDNNQQFQLLDVGDGYVQIVSRHSGKVLDVSDVSLENGANIHQWDYVGGANQQWNIEAVDNGIYRITSRYSGKCLDVDGVSTLAGANVHQWDYVGGANQQWYLEPVDGEPDPDPDDGDWSLVWSDEFNGSGQPNSANWNYHVGNGYNPDLPGFQGWGNGEWEWYRPENTYQSGGNMVIRADYSSTPLYTVEGREWFQTSGRITTQGKKSWQYGKIEARVSAPTAPGNWTAFWMLGDSSGGTYTSDYNPPSGYYDNMANTWASCGEIDIFEHINNDGTSYANCFWDNRIGVYPWTAGQNANYGTSATIPGGNAEQFHIYTLEWTSEYMRWFIDGIQTHEIDITPSQLEEFRKPFYIIFNMALGGTLPGTEPQISDFPLYMYVDYVRVYQ